MADEDITHRPHAIIETLFADLYPDGPPAHMPSGSFWVTSAWTVLAAITRNLLRAAGTLAGNAMTVARGATCAGTWSTRQPGTVLSSNATRKGLVLSNVGANNIYVNLAAGIAFTTNTLSDTELHTRTRPRRPYQGNHGYSSYPYDQPIRHRTDLGAGAAPAKSLRHAVSTLHL